MEEKKNVISIEDRIPKLKEARRKKTNRRLVFYVFLFFSLISIVVYLQSPLSYISEIEVQGNQYVSDEEIIKFTELSNETNIWAIRPDDIAERIVEHRELKEAKIERHFPNRIKINVKELDKVGYINDGEEFYPLLENGETLDSFRIVKWQGDAPLLYNFDDDEYLEAFVNELVQLPSSIISHISEVYWMPMESNLNQLVLYMNEGYQIETSIRNFANHIKTYPSIISQLNEDQLGIIRIGEGGAVFAPYPDASHVTEEETSEIDTTLDGSIDNTEEDENASEG